VSTSRRVVSGSPKTRATTETTRSGPEQRWYVLITRDPESEVIIFDSEEDARLAHEEGCEDLEPGMHCVLDRDEDEEDDDDW
jgi:hypothetical protein